MEVYSAISVKGIVMMHVIAHANVIREHAFHASIGLMNHDIVMIVIIQVVNGRMDMSTESTIIFFCGVFVGLLFEFIIAVIVMYKEDK